MGKATETDHFALARKEDQIAVNILISSRNSDAGLQNLLDGHDEAKRASPAAAEECWAMQMQSELRDLSERPICCALRWVGHEICRKGPGE